MISTARYNQISAEFNEHLQHIANFSFEQTDKLQAIFRKIIEDTVEMLNQAILAGNKLFNDICKSALQANQSLYTVLQASLNEMSGSIPPARDIFRGIIDGFKTLRIHILEIARNNAGMVKSLGVLAEGVVELTISINHSITHWDKLTKFEKVCFVAGSIFTLSAIAISLASFTNPILLVPATILGYIGILSMRKAFASHKEEKDPIAELEEKIEKQNQTIEKICKSIERDTDRDSSGEMTFINPPDPIELPKKQEQEITPSRSAPTPKQSDDD